MNAKNDMLREYYEECQELLRSFRIATLHHIPRGIMRKRID
jgi:hypothetical protein